MRASRQKRSASTTRTFWPASSFCTPSETTGRALVDAARDQDIAGLVSGDRDGAEDELPVRCNAPYGRPGAVVVEGRKRQAGDASVRRGADRDRRRHAELGGVAGFGQRVAGKVRAGRRVGGGRQLAQARREATVRVRPQRDARRPLAHLSDQDLRDGDHGVLLAGPRQADGRLADRHDLSGLDLRRRDDAVGIGDEGRIGQGVAGQRQGAFAADQAAARFFRRRLLPIVARRRRPTFAAQRGDAFQLRLRLCQRGAGRPDLGVGLLLLQPQVGFIEGREGLAGFDPVADLHQAACHLAGDAEAEIALDPGTDGADERPFRNMRGEGDARDQHRTLRSGLRLGCLVLAGGECGGQHKDG